MKIIDLMNNIVNGDLVPKTIQYNGDLYRYQPAIEDYTHIDTGRRLFDFGINAKELNKEITIFSDDYVAVVKGK